LINEVVQLFMLGL